VSSERSGDGVERRESEKITVAQLLAVCGSSGHNADGATFEGVWDALGESHPAVAGELVEHLRRAIDKSEGVERGTASGSEHPDWHETLDRAKSQSESGGYDAE